jgi:hypothetical protein
MVWMFKSALFWALFPLWSSLSFSSAFVDGSLHSQYIGRQSSVLISNGLRISREDFWALARRLFRPLSDSKNGRTKLSPACSPPSSRPLTIQRSSLRPVILASFFSYWSDASFLTSTARRRIRSCLQSLFICTDLFWIARKAGNHQVEKMSDLGSFNFDIGQDLTTKPTLCHDFRMMRQHHVPFDLSARVYVKVHESDFWKDFHKDFLFVSLHLKDSQHTKSGS